MSFSKWAKRQIFVLLVLLACSGLEGQVKVAELVRTLIDSSSAPFLNASCIYYWICNNIRYDVKALNDPDYPKYTPDQILARKKGICQDYSALMEAMCRQAGIEAYTISGYCKGFGYIPGDIFLRANHQWNVMFIDSSWVFADATWGSGAIGKKPGIVNLGLHRILKTPVVATKNVFVQKADSSYFDFSLQKKFKTHYPLDAKWFEMPTPPSFQSFQQDTVLALTDCPAWQTGIRDFRNKSEAYRIYTEGIDGHKYNTANYFDVAAGHWALVSPYLSNTEIDTGNVQHFRNYLKHYDAGIMAIKSHIALNDSIGKLRLRELKLLDKKNSKLTSRIIKQTRSSKKHSRAVRQRELKRDFAINKNWEALERKKDKLMRITLPANNKTPATPSEKDKETLHVKLFEREYNLEELRQGLDSCLKAAKNFVTNSAMLNDSLAFKNELFSGLLQNFLDTIATGDEATIRRTLDSVSILYYDIEGTLIRRKTLLGQLVNINRLVNTYIEEVRKNYTANLKDIIQLYMYSSSLSDTVISLYNNARQQLDDLFQLAIEYQQHLLHSNDLQKGFIRTNYDEAIIHKRLAKKVDRLFDAWYKHRYDEVEKKYEYEKEEARGLQINLTDGHKITAEILKKYEMQQKKYR